MHQLRNRITCKQRIQGGHAGSLWIVVVHVSKLRGGGQPVVTGTLLSVPPSPSVSLHVGFISTLS